MFACAQKNLGERACGQAVRRGVLLAGFSLIFALIAVELNQARALGWFLILPVAGAAYQLISGVFGICIYHGLKGVRGADHGAEAVLDQNNRAHMRTRAVLAVSGSLLIGCIFAAAYVASA